jgi:3' exoribonuclease, RNase T-like
MKRAMIDIETLGTSAEAIIAEIGVVISEVGKIDYSFNCTLDWREQEMLGRKADVFTLLWWTQDDRIKKFQELAKKNNFNRGRLHEVLNGLVILLRDCDEIWANSPTFDIAIVNDLLKQTIGCKLSYKTAMDFRTARKLHPDILYEYPEDAHNALTDAQAQVAHLRKLGIWPDWPNMSDSEAIKTGAYTKEAHLSVIAKEAVND